jgi:hypothetical protein
MVCCNVCKRAIVGAANVLLSVRHGLSYQSRGHDGDSGAAARASSGQFKWRNQSQGVVALHTNHQDTGKFLGTSARA